MAGRRMESVRQIPVHRVHDRRGRHEARHQPQRRQQKRQREDVPQDQLAAQGDRRRFHRAPTVSGTVPDTRSV